MPHRSSLAKRRSARKLLLASLCLAAATTWNVLSPAPAQASGCANLCEYACESMGSYCLGFWNSEGFCDFECA